MMAILRMDMREGPLSWPQAGEDQSPAGAARLEETGIRCAAHKR